MPPKSFFSRANMAYFSLVLDFLYFCDRNLNVIVIKSMRHFGKDVGHQHMWWSRWSSFRPMTPSTFHLMYSPLPRPWWINLCLFSYSSQVVFQNGRLVILYSLLRLQIVSVRVIVDSVPSVSDVSSLTWILAAVSRDLYNDIGSSYWRRGLSLVSGSWRGT